MGSKKPAFIWDTVLRYLSSYIYDLLWLCLFGTKGDPPMIVKVEALVENSLAKMQKDLTKIWFRLFACFKS